MMLIKILHKSQNFRKSLNIINDPKKLLNLQTYNSCIVYITELRGTLIIDLYGKL